MELNTKDLILRTVTADDIEEIARMWRYPQEITLEDAQKALEKMEGVTAVEGAEAEGAVIL